MLRQFVLLAGLLLACSVPVFAQGHYCTWVYDPTDGGPPLTTTCQGSTPIPDGTVVKIFWDVDSDGPDLTDPQPTLCDVPPVCEEGPSGTVNYISFEMNGQALEIGPGYFFTEVMFRSVGFLPTPPRYYLRIYELDGVTVLWTSTVKTLVSGPQEVRFLGSDWTCGAGGPQCFVRDEHE